MNPTQVDLSWFDSEVMWTRYEVEWKFGGGYPWRGVGPPHETDSALVYSDRNLKPSVKYIYRVRAVFDDGETGAWSDEVLAVTPKRLQFNLWEILRYWQYLIWAVVAAIIITLATVLWRVADNW